MVISIDTHSYDYKFKDIYKNLLKIDNYNLSKPKDLKTTLDEIYTRITSLPPENHTNHAIRSIKLIYYDQLNNIDITNNIDLSDLLTRAWRFIKYYEDSSFQIFVEQLSEIYSQGSCPQGRVIRILQFYRFHIEEKDKFYKMNIIK